MLFKRTEYVSVVRSYEYELNQEELQDLNDFLNRRYEREDGYPIEPIKMEDIPVILNTKNKSKEGQVLVSKMYPNRSYTTTTYSEVYNWINDGLWEGYVEEEGEDCLDVTDYICGDGDKQTQFNYEGIIE